MRPIAGKAGSHRWCVYLQTLWELALPAMGPYQPVQNLTTYRNPPAPLGPSTQQTLYPQDSPQLMWASRCFSR
ncbi:protein of unknown function [Pseudomonas sp. JV241A]|nr:protein of unknown function [Pseudomonas sp. JV241A]